jgi:glycosyltransferase involved in cell wall biosynthesis
MKVCLIGDTEGPRDEGMRNTNLHLVEELKNYTEILMIKPGEYLSSDGVRKMKAFKPDIIHYLQGPTIRSLALCRVLRFLFPKTKVVLLALNPSLSTRLDVILPYLAPHHVFSITKGFHERLTCLGISSQIVYLGVDQERFRPADEKIKKDIRKSLGIPENKKIVLHIGHFTEVRGVPTLGQLQAEIEPEVQFVVVGSSTNRSKSLVVENLRGHGVMVMTDFIPEIERLYQASDAYIFPGARSDSAIDIPLSILEAMAVNLPIITTPFGGLPDIFKERPWFRYVESVDSMRETVKEVLFPDVTTSETRNMVIPYTWDMFAKIIIDTYEKIANKGSKS